MGSNLWSKTFERLHSGESRSRPAHKARSAGSALLMPPSATPQEISSAVEFGSHVINERLRTFNPVNNRVGIERRFVHLLVADGNDTTVWATISKLAREMLPNRTRQRVKATEDRSSRTQRARPPRWGRA